MKYIFGPVLSRRLGASLGLDIVPYKTCTFDCIYCECGSTTEKTILRKPYIDAEKILVELRDYLKSNQKPDYITLTGSGEPTLNSEIGLLIRQIKKITKAQVAVLTNSSLLYLPEVRNDLMPADLVVPSLDAALSGSFNEINRPHEGLELLKIIQGMIAFREEFKGEIWLELLFVKGVNNQDKEIEALIRVIKEIQPDKVQVNTVDRPPAEKTAMAIDKQEIEDIYNRFKAQSLPVEIITSNKKKNAIESFEMEDLKDKIINLIKRRPETGVNMAKTFGVSINYINKVLRDLEEQKIIKRKGEFWKKGVVS